MTTQEENLIWLDSFEFLTYTKKSKLIDIFNGKSVRLNLVNKKYECSSVISEDDLRKLIKYSSDEYFNSLIKEYEKKNIKILTLYSYDYPMLLREIPNPPLILYCMGNLQLLDTICCGVVGTRKPSEYGALITKQFATELANSSVTIVSGMASGIDTIAHEATLKTGGSTIAVIAGGFDHIYPAVNQNLFKRIIENNLVITENKPSTKPQPYLFPIRNRIVAGLSKAILIPEAGLNSGSIHTKNYAVEYGREIFAVPGRINSPESEGTNNIIKECQACLCTDVSQITDFLGIANKKNEPKPAFQLDITEQTILNYILAEKKSYQEIADYTGISSRELNTILFNMQLKGYIDKLAGNSYISLIKLN